MGSGIFSIYYGIDPLKNSMAGHDILNFKQLLIHFRTLPYIFLLTKSVVIYERVCAALFPPTKVSKIILIPKFPSLNDHLGS